jgi:hypothetical protein
MTLLIVAFYLAILTFYLGVLVYALPIPISGLKRWGPRLINDAFFIATLASSIELIISVADYIRMSLGGDWNDFFYSIRGLLFLRSLFILALSSISSTISRILPGFSRIMSVGLNILTASLYSLTLIYFLGMVVYYSIATIASLGITLMAIPFRVARNAGAFLLSFALVFYIALPLYPHFVLLLTTPLPRTTLNLAIVYGDVTNFLGYKISSGYIGVKIGEEYIGPAKLEPGGRMFIFIPRDYMDEQAIVYFDVTGHRFYTNVSGTPLSNLCTTRLTAYMCQINIEVKGLIYYSNGIALHVHPPPLSVENIIENSSGISLTLTSDTDTKLYVSAVESYSINSVLVDGIAIANIDECKAYEWNWYNVKGATYIIPIPNGHHDIYISFKINSFEGLEPSVENLYPGKIIQYNISWIDALNYLTSSIYLEIISSILYISLLLSATYGLSKLLGGGAKLRLIP